MTPHESLTLRACRERLLDLGKRNRLYAYKPTERHLSILAPGIDALYSSFAQGLALPVYDLDTALPRLGITLEKYVRNEGQELVIEEANESGEVCFALNKEKKCSRTLKNIMGFAASSLEERGINTLYLAFGFLHWKEKDGLYDAEIVSPILLYPASLHFKDGKYSIAPLEAEGLLLNTTLALALKSQYGIALPPLDSEETPASYFSKIEGLLLPSWRLEPTSSLGVFSFAKLDMYQDLGDHEEEVLASPIIQKLFHPENGDSFLREEKEEGHSPLHLVVPADSSQKKAIRAAKEGLSFVLEGPPGTGKSQTIANIIAEALYDGKKVLFVSEKAAALQVVYEKLSKVGLGDFALNLHAAKSAKGVVASSIKSTMDRYSSMEETPLPCEDAAGLEKALSDYDAALHGLYPPLGLAPFEVFASAKKFADAPSLQFAFPKIEAVPYSEFAGEVSLLSSILSGFGEFGREYEDYPLFGILPDLDYSKKSRLQDAISTSLRFFEEFASFVDDFEDLPLLDLPSGALSEFHYCCGKIASASFLDPAFFLPKAKGFYRELRRYLKLAEDKKGILAQVKRTFSVAITPKIEKSFASIPSFKSPLNRLFSRNYATLKKELPAYLKKAKPGYEDFAEAFEILESLKETERSIAVALSSLGKFINVSLLENPRFVSDALLFEDLPVDLSPYGPHLDCLKEFARLFSSLSVSKEAEALECIRSSFDLTVKDLSLLPMGRRIEHTQELADCLGRYETYISFVSSFQEAEGKGLAPFLEEFRKTAYPLELGIPAFNKVYYEEWGHRLLESIPALTAFGSATHDEAIATYKKIISDSYALSSLAVKNRFIASFPRGRGEEGVAPSLASLYREVSKKKKIPSARRLLESYPEAILTVKPIFLMSPLSVSTYLSSSFHFDLVVFDEASQVYPQDALPSLYRASQAIIVGDDKQMPPSNFFQTESEGDETSDIGDFESILDYFAPFPHIRLLWHYRSKDESLIAFSNRAFYGDSLITFPCAKKEEGEGVSFHYVPNGVYVRKSGVNPEEAKEVAALAYAHYQKNPSASLGIIAFSLSEQEEIEEQISEIMDRDQGFASWFSSSKEPCFLKNLENVQGDERDFILLSVGYGYDSEKRFYHNFGPLNALGGERRLNVAITRARKGLTVVSSIRSPDIDPSKVTSVGPKLLRDFLFFAENKNLNFVLPTREENFESPFEEDVAREIEKLGYDYRCQVGSSSFRIDLAVLDKDQSHYILAVECDGATYHQGKDAFDRDVLRQQILESHGWKFHRIWSTNWFSDRQKEVIRLSKALQEASLASPIEEETPPEPLPPSPMEEEEEEGPAPIEIETIPFVPFEPSPIQQKRYYAASYSLPRLMAVSAPDVVEAEQPISFERLARCLSRLSGRNRVAASFKETLLAILPRIPGIVQAEDGYFLREEKPLPFRERGERSIEEISSLELSYDMLALLSGVGALAPEELFKAASRALGFSRSGAAMKARFSSALDILYKRGLCFLDARGMLIPSKK